jgi:hypothetical protein
VVDLDTQITLGFLNARDVHKEGEDKFFFSDIVLEQQRTFFSAHVGNTIEMQLQLQLFTMELATSSGTVIECKIVKKRQISANIQVIKLYQLSDEPIMSLAICLHTKVMFAGLSSGKILKQKLDTAEQPIPVESLYSSVNGS